MGLWEEGHLFRKGQAPQERYENNHPVPAHPSSTAPALPHPPNIYSRLLDLELTDFGTTIATRPWDRRLLRDIPLEELAGARIMEAEIVGYTVRTLSMTQERLRERAAKMTM